MKKKILTFLYIVSLGAVLLLSGCGRKNGTPVSSGAEGSRQESAAPTESDVPAESREPEGPRFVKRSPEILLQGGSLALVGSAEPLLSGGFARTELEQCRLSEQSVQLSFTALRAEGEQTLTLSGLIFLGAPEDLSEEMGTALPEEYLREKLTLRDTAAKTEKASLQGRDWVLGSAREGSGEELCWDLLALTEAEEGRIVYAELGLHLSGKAEDRLEAEEGRIREWLGTLEIREAEQAFFGPERVLWLEGDEPLAAGSLVLGTLAEYRFRAEKLGASGAELSLEGRTGSLGFSASLKDSGRQDLPELRDQNGARLWEVSAEREEGLVLTARSGSLGFSFRGEAADGTPAWEKIEAELRNWLAAADLEEGGAR